MHVVVAALLALAPRLVPAPLAPFEVEVTMEALPPERSVETDAVAHLEPTLEPVVASSSGARGRATERALSPVVASVETAVTIGLEGIVPSTELVPAGPIETPEERAERIRRALDPRRVALDMVLGESPGPSMRGEPAGTIVAPEVELLTEAEAEGRHGGYLAERAMVREWLSHHAIEPHPRPDGTWVYEGPLFTATIDEEGAVDFDDIDAVEVDFATGTATFDVMDMVMRGAGYDPYFAEHERFMEETETLRLRIEEDHLVGVITRNVTLLRGELRRIWDDVDRAASARRRDVFRRWDQNDESRLGAARREAVLDFVRTDIPFGSDDAFSEAEIGALNALRESHERFDPY